MKTEIGGGQIQYEMAGESGPAVFLVHGLGGTLRQWHGVAATLSGSCRVIVPDLRGHGGSDTPAGPYSVEQWADDLAALAKSLRIDKAAFVGASVSGAVVLRLAATRPELVQAAVTVGGFAALPSAARDRMTQRAGVVEKEGLAAVADAVLGGQLSASAPPSLVGLAKGMLLANDPRAYAACTRAVAAADVQGLLGQVKCPVLLLFGAEEKVAPLPLQSALKRALPHAQVRSIPLAGHLAFLEQPAAVSAALLEFLAALP